MKKLIILLLIVINIYSADFSRDGVAGVVTDHSTNLMWYDGANISMSWSAVITHCENLDLGSYTDWRLPNINELRSILDRNRTPRIDPIFLNAVSQSYWSATTYTGLTYYARNVAFSSGQVDAANKSYSNYVRCVRDE